MEVPEHVDTLLIFESGSINTIIKDNHGTINTGGGKEKDAEDKSEPGEMPKELQTDEANALLEKFLKAGMLDENYQPVKLSNPEKSVLASFISSRLWNENRWKPFEDLWGMNSLSSYYSKALNQSKTTNLIEKIKKVL